jgi:hypothetical protein
MPSLAHFLKSWIVGFCIEGPFYGARHTKISCSPADPSIPLRPRGCAFCNLPRVSHRPQALDRRQLPSACHDLPTLYVADSSLFFMVPGSHGWIAVTGATAQFAHDAFGCVSLITFFVRKTHV